MLKRLLLDRLHAAVLLLFLGAVCACSSDRGGEPPAPASSANQAAIRDRTALPPSQPIPRRRPPRRHLPELRTGDRPVYVQLVLEGQDIVCWIDGRRLAVLPTERARVLAHLVEVAKDPEHIVAVLAINPRVPHAIVTDLVSDLTNSGIKRMVFAAPAAPQRTGRADPRSRRS